MNGRFFCNLGWSTLLLVAVGCGGGNLEDQEFSETEGEWVMDGDGSEMTALVSGATGVSPGSCSAVTTDIRYAHNTGSVTTELRWSPSCNLVWARARTDASGGVIRVLSVRRYALANDSDYVDGIYKGMSSNGLFFSNAFRLTGKRYHYRACWRFGHYNNNGQIVTSQDSEHYCTAPEMLPPLE